MRGASARVLLITIALVAGAAGGPENPLVARGRPFRPAAAPQPGRNERSAYAASADDRWMQFLTEYVSSGGGRNSLPGWPKGAVKVDLPVAQNAGGLPSSVPVFVLPVPVPVRDTSQECAVNQQDRFDQVDASYEYSPRRPAAASREPPRRGYLFETPRRRPEPLDDDYDDSPASPPLRPETPGKTPPPTMKEVNSKVLVELFRAQRPSAPHLPPVLIRERRFAETTPPPPPLPTPAPPFKTAPAPAPYPPAHPTPPPRPREPPRPSFDRPLAIRGELTVYRADYTEPYTAWWDPATGNSRVEMHDGATTAYRTVRAGQVDRLAMSIDRSGDKEVMRCSVMKQRESGAPDRAPPVLPDMHPFSFDGFAETEGTVAERWRHTVTEQPAGASETLTARHELLVTRAPDHSAVPMRYSVSVDSSVLGPASDGYVHAYREVYVHAPEPAHFAPDIESACESVEQTGDLSRVEPLREFVLPHRDPQHDEFFKEYTKEFERNYTDSAEEAVRRNLVTQSRRFVASGNREGASFAMALNFLSDRLDAELQALLGVVLDDEHFPAEPFPHARSSLRDLEEQLPDEFDWRTRGGVSPVKYQGSCSSCWAFAVAGAVEGALFRQTRRLVPLSEQCLVDCAQPYGGRGCGGTWPSHAYDYVQDRGLPAEAEYVPYQAKVLQCQDKRVKPVTQISAHVNVTAHSVPALKVAIRRHAPSVVIIDAMLKSFQTYKSGVFYDDRCAKTKGKLKHAVLAVGWGQRDGEPHFILKNSWSAAWADGGYIRVHGPSNTCGVLTLPSYPRLERDDVLRTDVPAQGGKATAQGGKSAAQRGKAAQRGDGPRGRAAKVDDDDYD